MNKYLEKLSGLPISGKTLPMVARTYTKMGLDFADKVKTGNIKPRDLLKFTNSAKRLNSNLPKSLRTKLENLQKQYLLNNAK